MRYAVLLICLAGMAQETSRPVFEVVSVKPATDGRLGIGLYVYAGGRIHATNYRLRQLIHDAYDVEMFRILGGPDWLDLDRFTMWRPNPPRRPTSSSGCRRALRVNPMPQCGSCSRVCLLTVSN